MRKRKASIPSVTPHRVAVALRMAGIAGQDKLNGIFDFLDEDHRWQLIIYRTNADWSRNRGIAFKNAISAAGFPCRMFDVPHYKDKVEDKETIAAWLKSLPKPCGILAACDDRAFELLDLMMSGRRIPPKQNIRLVGISMRDYRNSSHEK